MIKLEQKDRVCYKCDKGAECKAPDATLFIKENRLREILQDYMEEHCRCSNGADRAGECCSFCDEYGDDLLERFALLFKDAEKKE